jgi:hypothetical protein
MRKLEAQPVLPQLLGDRTITGDRNIIEASITIRRPVEEVFGFYQCQANSPENDLRGIVVEDECARSESPVVCR